MTRPGGKMPSSGPGSGTPRMRTAARPAQRAARAAHQPVAAVSPAPVDVNEPTAPERMASAARRGGIRLTQRMIAVIAVFALLLISYASSLRIYFQQQSELSAAKAEIATREAEISSLQDELARWQDPGYVRAQARARLGWVIPGEIGFKVLDGDGNLLGSGSTIERTGALPDGEHADTWFDQLWGSVLTADDPAPATPADAQTAPVTVDTATDQTPAATEESPS